MKVSPAPRKPATSRRPTDARLEEVDGEVDEGPVGPVLVAAGARVARGARLQRTILWPGAVATGDLADAVVTPTETIQIAD